MDLRTQPKYGGCLMQDPKIELESNPYIATPYMLSVKLDLIHEVVINGYIRALFPVNRLHHLLNSPE